MYVRTYVHTYELEFFDQPPTSWRHSSCYSGLLTMYDIAHQPDASTVNSLMYRPRAQGPPVFIFFFLKKKKFTYMFRKQKKKIKNLGANFKIVHSRVTYNDVSFPQS